MYKIKNIGLALQGKRGQLNVDFIVAVLLLSFVVVSTVIFIIRFLPGFSSPLDEADLHSRALAVEKLLLEQPGVPANWTYDPVVIGLAAFNNYSNETIKGGLDPIKLVYLNTTDSVNYSITKTNLSMNESVNFYLEIQSSWGIMKYFNYTPAKTDTVVAFHKLMAINRSAANVTLLIW